MPESLSVFLIPEESNTNEIQSVQDCFKKLRGFLDTEEQKELQKLVKEEGDTLHDLEQSESELVQQSQVLRDLISELEHQLQGSTVKMLLVRLGKKPQHLNLRKMKSKFLALLCDCDVSGGDTEVLMVLQ